MYKDYNMNVVLKLYFDIFYFRDMLVSKLNVFIIGSEVLGFRLNLIVKKKYIVIIKVY